MGEHDFAGVMVMSWSTANESDVLVGSTTVVST